MRFVKISVLVLVVTAGSVFGQIGKQIAAIRTDVAAINKAGNRYEKKTRNIEGISTEGAEAVYYLSGKGLKKIVANVYGETFRATIEFYYSGEELLFAFQKISRYSGSIGTGSPPKIARIEETRIYRTGGRTIRILQGKKILSPDTTEFTEKEYELIEFSDQLKAALAK